ncbi:MAG: hypothetical protein ACTSV7_00105 [Candidatus Baldrarchaeia archaeon]
MKSKIDIKSCPFCNADSSNLVLMVYFDRLIDKPVAEVYCESCRSHYLVVIIDFMAKKQKKRRLEG